MSSNHSNGNRKRAKDFPTPESAKPAAGPLDTIDLGDEISPTPTTGNQVWECFDELGDLAFQGYLITTDNPHIGIAFIPVLLNGRDEYDPKIIRARHDGVARAQEIASNPDVELSPAVAARHRGTLPAMDLRRYSRLESTEPVPHRFYGYVVAPLHHGPNHTTGTCFLFCRFRFAKLASVFASLVWTAEEREKYPHTLIEIEDDEQCGGIESRIDMKAAEISI